MVTFTGEIINGEGTEYFEYGFDAGADGQRSCGGWSQELITGKKGHEFTGDTLAWGYDGNSSRLLAINILTTALDPDWLCFPNYNDACRHKDRALILKHYIAFTKEIVANLPDSWTMTSDEVLAWIKAKEDKCS